MTSGATSLHPPYLPPRLWSLRINPSLPGTCLDFYRDASSALCTPRQPLDRIVRTHVFHALRPETTRKSSHVGIRTHEFRASKLRGYLLDHSGDEKWNVKYI